ncbi:MAG: SUMF1/EgtB/PvdO family nonheme iron enzyme, partial [Proteobacteria bacterium]|nr:SUMF1/EgtB/PvdO family nonheme iron enzyme [Pseudomonadota bacterium]
LQVDNIKTDLDNAGQLEITRGPHQLRIESARYLPHEQQIEIEGYGKEQQLDIKLRPAWANISISSQPGAAMVRVDGEPIGRTPLTAPILQGLHKVELNLPGFKPLSATQEIEAGKDRAWAPFQMQAVDGKLSVSSQPDNASITLDGIFLGMSPMDLDIVANSAHSLRLSKSGYVTVEKEIILQPDELRRLDVRLEAEYGTIFLSTYPADAKLLIDGKIPDKKNGRFQLSVRPHTFTLSKTGYATRKLSVTPRQGVSQNIEMKLETLQHQAVQKKITATPDTINGPTGQTLKLIKPDSSFTMGASRREAGRRANESRRLVELRRPFYFAGKEITNHEYRLFKPAHRSGSQDGANLDGEHQPVVSISWDDVARYCNWLSRKQGLPESYGEQNGKMLAVQPLTTGYRLPTEAEWAWVARRHLQATEQRYPWAGSYPPQKADGNYADARIADTLADVVPDYDDGYRGSASVGSFPARPEGIYDLGGNVAEWMHDYYALYPGEAGKLVIDPSGPGTATHHVVRGASWRHGNITELRLSYRDYSNKPRYDLGFRIARYAE